MPVEMLFPTLTFAVFFTVVLVGAWALHRHLVAWQVLLLTAGLVFVGWWDKALPTAWLVLIAGTHLAATVMTRGLTEGLRRSAFWAGIGFAVGILGYFKYADFFVTAAQDALGRLGLAPHLPLVEVAVPLGLSFVTFQAIAYLIELRQGAIDPLRWRELALCLCFFPIAMAGPITRPSELAPQVTRTPDGLHVDTTRALVLISRGLFKKLVLASFLATHLTDGIFATPGEYSSAEILVGLYATAALIYADFSGYSDMAIGLALLLGIRVPDNFHRPYTARSPEDFWRRWHLTLTRWFRDFLFTPLVLHSRRAWMAPYGAMVIVWAVTGLWHGAAWTFVAWGLVNGAALMAERAWRQHRRARGRRRPPDTVLRSVVTTVLTFHFVCLTWVLFRAESIGGALDVLVRLCTAWGPAPEVTPLVLAAIAVTVGAQFVPADLAHRALVRFAAAPLVAQTVAFALFFAVTGALGPEGVAPFIYFRF